MKTMNKIIAFTIGLFAVLFASCTDIDSDATISKSNFVPKEVKEISFTAQADDSVLSFADSRTIIPGSLTYSSLKYYLAYKDNQAGQTTFSVKEVTFKPDGAVANKGTVTLELEDSYYDFQLYATQTAVAAGNQTDTYLKANAILWGNASADLRNNDSVHFYLTSDGLTGNGSASLKLYTTSDWEYTSAYDTAYTTTVGLYDIKDGTLIGSSTNLTSTTFPKGAAPSDANFTSGAVNPGTYNLEVRFLNTQTNKTYVWSDRLIVLPGKATEAEIAIPEILELPPAAPENFVVDYEEPSTGDFYKVEFRWDDKANNELNFLLQLLTVDEGTDAVKITAMNTPWTDTYLGSSGINTNIANSVTYSSRDDDTKTNDYEDEVAFYGNNDVWVSGSLQKNNKVAVFKLPLGRRYLARICASNDAGKSEWVYAILATSANDGLATPKPAQATTLSTMKYFDTSVKAINLYRLTYELTGGTLTQKADAAVKTGLLGSTAAGGADLTSKASIVQYHAQGETVNIFDPSDGSNDPAYTLIKSGKNWVSWKKDKQTGDALNFSTESPYKGFKNFTLYANYTQETADVNIKDDNELNITAAEVSVPTGTGVTQVIAKKHYQFDKSATGANAIAFELTPKTTVNYDHVSMVIKKMGESGNVYNVPMTKGASKYTATENFKSYRCGTYSVTFEGYTSKNVKSAYTYTLYIEIVE